MENQNEYLCLREMVEEIFLPDEAQGCDDQQIMEVLHMFIHDTISGILPSAIARHQNN